ncbi:MAG TPA: hypothetical protein VFH08_10670 [Chitinophagaceae bacterium]|nr:hypothetical protein [Chitinophagaceae bacterium]
MKTPEPITIPATSNIAVGKPNTRFNGIFDRSGDVFVSVIIIICHLRVNLPLYAFFNAENKFECTGLSVRILEYTSLQDIPPKTKLIVFIQCAIRRYAQSPLVPHHCVILIGFCFAGTSYQRVPNNSTFFITRLFIFTKDVMFNYGKQPVIIRI